MLEAPLGVKSFLITLQIAPYLAIIAGELDASVLIFIPGRQSLN
jgi:hypothetical protein